MAGETKTEGPNDHVFDYLDYYTNPTNAFDFAVMLRGPWGSGKTYLIKQFINYREGLVPPKKTLYVSLYGISSLRQIDDEFYRQLHPVLSSKGMRFATQILKGVGKVALKIDLDEDGTESTTLNTQIPEIDLQEYLKTPEDCLLIFDDLERCSLPVHEVLGYINSFVEHDGFKAVIGQWGGGNLRVLKHSLWDFERFGVCLSEAHWEKELPVKILFRVILALAFEIRSGKLLAEKLPEIKVNSISRHLRAKSGEEPGIASNLEKKYPETKFDQTIVSEALLKALLFEGQANQEAIRKELDNSVAFGLPGSEPAWRTAWQVGRVEDAVYEKAVVDVEDQFTKREFLIPEEFFQVVGLRLLFSEMGMITQSKGDVVVECEAYINNHRDDGKIINKYSGGDKFDPSIGWGGLGSYNTETDEFKQVFTYYENVVDEISANDLPQLGKDLLALMKADHEKYGRSLFLNNFERSAYYDVPILATIPPQDFVDQVLALDASAQIDVLHTFRIRYERNLLSKELAGEKPWLRKLKDLFESKAATQRPIVKYRILSALRTCVDPFIE